ncbi:hypothetical protein GJ496_010708 [Pomphorhynchus laevis]|nr:hypothetical protein GJ496_010708 [Pomphorhynchus laevis]
MTNPQFIQSTLPHPTAAVRPVFANSTFNIYTHLDTKELRPIIAQQPTQTTAGIMQYRLIDNGNQYEQALKQQPRFIHAYNRLIFQNPRIQNIQHLVLPTFSYPYANNNPYHASTHGIMDHTNALMFGHNREPMDMNPVKIRHLQDISEIKDCYSSSDQWDNESSVSGRSFGSTNRKHVTNKYSEDRRISAGDKKHISSNTANEATTATTAAGGEANNDDKDSVTNFTHQINQINTKIHNEGKCEGTKEECKDNKKATVSEREQAGLKFENAANNGKVKAQLATHQNHGSSKKQHLNSIPMYLDPRNSYSFSMRQRHGKSDGKKEYSRIYKVHERPLYERYQEAFRESIRKGEYWRKKAKRQQRISEAAKFQIFPHFDNSERIHQIPLEYLTTVPLEPSSMPVRPTNAFPYNVANPNIPHLVQQEQLNTFGAFDTNSPCDIPEYDMIITSREISKLQKKVHNLNLKMKNMKKEFSSVKHKEFNASSKQDKLEKDPSVLTKSGSNNGVELHPNLVSTNNQQQHYDKDGSAEINPEGDRHNVMNNVDASKEVIDTIQDRQYAVPQTSERTSVVEGSGKTDEKAERSTSSKLHNRLSQTEKKKLYRYGNHSIYRHASADRSSNNNYSSSLTYRYLKNTRAPSYKWANAPPPPILSHNTHYISYENPLQACSTFCALHNSSDTDDCTDVSSTADKYAFSAVEQCSSPRLSHQMHHRKSSNSRFSSTTKSFKSSFDPVLQLDRNDLGKSYKHICSKDAVVRMHFDKIVPDEFSLLCRSIIS